MKQLQNIAYIGNTHPVSASTFYRPVKANFDALSSTNAGSGAELIGVSLSATNYSQTGNSVFDHLTGINTKFGTLNAATLTASATPTNYTKVDSSIEGHLQGILTATSNKNPIISTGATTQYILGNQSLATLNATVVPASSTPTNYTKITSSVEGHLMGINTALGTKEPIISTGTSVQYIRGDKSLATLNATVVPASSTPTNYTKVTNSIEGHLMGIDTKLGNITTISNNGLISRAAATSSTETIAHGLGRTPTRIDFVSVGNNDWRWKSVGSVDSGLHNMCTGMALPGGVRTPLLSTTKSILFGPAATDYNGYVSSWDSTNFVITWTSSTAAYSVYVLWTAE
jgi:hypothetical protein